MIRVGYVGTKRNALENAKNNSILTQNWRCQSLYTEGYTLRRSEHLWTEEFDVQ
jgi:hypothetical protein